MFYDYKRDVARMDNDSDQDDHLEEFERLWPAFEASLRARERAEASAAQQAAIKKNARRRASDSQVGSRYRAVLAGDGPPARLRRRTG